MKRLVLLILWSGLALAEPRDEVRWRHEVECLGDAVKAVLVKPGADGSAAAMALHYQRGGWSRFNWPLFRPVTGNAGLRFQVRREGALPRGVLLRLLCSDGVEWSLKETIPLTETWQTCEVKADDFRVYRGGGADRLGVLDFTRVMQGQFLPISSQEGDGVILVDTLSFVPNGPVFTHDEDEWRGQTPPAAVEFARLRDLSGRYQHELAQLAGGREHVAAWITALRACRDEWPRDRVAAQARLANPLAPWKQRAGLGEAAAIADMTQAAFDARLAALQSRPRFLLNDYRHDGLLSNHVLYEAVPQPAPQRLAAAGEMIVRQEFVFTGDDTAQTAFLNIDVPAGEDGRRVVDVSKRVVVMKLRCTARGLNEQRPFLLRLSSEHPEGLEAFVDLPPEPMPGAEWTECRFDVSRPFRGVRFDPGKITRLAFRVENIPGQADRFALEVGAMYLDHPSALVTVRDEYMATAQGRLLAARLELLSARKELLQLEDDLRELPGLREAYLCSFNQPVTGRAPAMKPVVLPAYDGPDVAAHTFRTRAYLVAGQPMLGVCLSTAAARLCVELRGAAGGGVLAAQDWGGGMVPWQEQQLPLQVPLWSPGNPQLFALRLLAYDERGGLLAAARREIGFRESAVFSSGMTPVLRHGLSRRRPDWYLRYNGQAAFPRTAAYSGMEESLVDCPRETQALLADLWVDGGRFYGIKLGQSSWSLLERSGVAQLAGFGPSYKALKSWEDMALFEQNLAFTAERMAGPSSHASPYVLQVGNEVELDSWGASINAAFPGAAFQPLDFVAERLRRERLASAPVMYVRAGHFNTVVPLPHEDISGINQYTGRYSGRLDEVHRDLAELAAEASLFNRPLMITEWNGPKYSWATGGVGGVSTRGAAYYLERYWRALVETPGVIGSAEFTLNWVFAPFEDLTNQSREDAWRHRPRHAGFGGGHTADHVPLLDADQVVPDDCYRSMQAFHGPLYTIARMPGDIHVVAAACAGELAAALRPMSRLGKAVVVDARGPALLSPEELPRTSHCVVVLPVGEAALPAAWSALLSPLAAGAAEPLIRSLVHPTAPDYLLCVIQAGDDAALLRGIARLGQSAAALLELRENESRMTRALALIDRNRELVFQRYVLDQAGRGYFFSGDDTRTALLAADFYADDGRLLPCWSALSVLYLDAPRELTAAEWSLVERLQAAGVALVISSGCYQANGVLQAAYPAQLEADGDLSQRIELHESLRGPAPVRYLGGAELAVIRRFAPAMLTAPGVGVSAIQAAGATSLAWAAGGQPMVVSWPATAGRGKVVLLGYQLGDVAQVHWRVTHSGKTHPIYDRDTACGLERASLVAVNAGLPAVGAAELRQPLQLVCVPESFLVAAGEVARLTVTVRDAAGRPVPGAQLNARVRVRTDGRSGASSDYLRLRDDGQGNFNLVCVSDKLAVDTEDGKAVNRLRYALGAHCAEQSRVVSVQLKAWAPGQLPADSALAFVLSE